MHRHRSSPIHCASRAISTLDLSRWKWLVKWFLAIPHFVVLAFLWVAFVVLTFVAFFAILFTGRYPRSIFEFNVGVLRWSWRVAYYATSVLGTDRYPPFTLSAVEYPASLEVAYPEHLSRGLVLVKSWLLAIPHLLIVGAATASWGAGGSDEGARFVFSGGLLGLVVMIAAITPPRHRALPGWAVRPDHGGDALDVPSHRLRRADDGRVPAVPPRPGWLGTHHSERDGTTGEPMTRAATHGRSTLAT